MKNIKYKINELFDKVLQKMHLLRYKDVILFLIILLFLHFGLNGWNRVNNYPIGDQIDGIEERLKAWSFIGAGYTINAVGYDIANCKDSAFFEAQAAKNIYYQTPPDCYTYYFTNTDSTLRIVNACSGFKQLLITFLLLLLFPGPWKQKLWFIPTAIVLMFITNIVRITLLAIFLLKVPQHWDFFHMNITRPGYYVILFFIWVWWNEKFYHPSINKKQNG